MMETLCCKLPCCERISCNIFLTLETGNNVSQSCCNVIGIKGKSSTKCVYETLPCQRPFLQKALVNRSCHNKYLQNFHIWFETFLSALIILQWTRQFRVIDSSGSPSHKHFCFSRMSKYTDLLIIQSFS